jgi:hypothetical protein
LPERSLNEKLGAAVPFARSARAGTAADAISNPVIAINRTIRFVAMLFVSEPAE